MKLPTSEDDDPVKIKETLLKFESPFSWDLPEEHENSNEVFIKILSEKCVAVEEEHQFQWTRFVPQLILSYELCEKMADYEQALHSISWCADHWNSLERQCKEPLFNSLRDIIPRVIHATKAHILLASGEVHLALKEAGFLSNDPFRPHRLRPTTSIRTAGLFGLKAAVCLQYSDSKRALEYAKAAKNLDPNQAEWWFIIGNSLGRIRRHNNSDGGIISAEEVEAIEKAFALHRDASYTVHLAQLYADYAKQMVFARRYNEGGTYATKAVARFREALQIRPNCTYLKARVAHGMLKIRFKGAMDIKFAKDLLDEVVKTCPNRSMVYADLGYYYSQHNNKDIEKAIFNYQKAMEIGFKRGFMLLAALKWKNGLEGEVIHDVSQCLHRHQGAEDQAMLYSYLGAYHILIHDNWEAAILCFQKSLGIDPSAQFLENFSGFNGRYVNLLELICNHLQFQKVGGNKNEFKSFLALVAQKKPQKIQVGLKNGFMNWKKLLEECKEVKTVYQHLKPKVSKDHEKTLIENDQDNNSNQIISTLAVMSSQIGELIKSQEITVSSVNNLAANLATKEEVELIGNEVEELKGEVKSIDKKVEVLEPRVTDAETRLEELGSKVENLEQIHGQLQSVEEVIREMNDRTNRATNIILHNLPESVDEAPRKRIVHDKGLLLKICQAMNYKLGLKGIKVIRIGKQSMEKRRPMVVVFKTANEAKLFSKMLSTESVSNSVKSSDPSLADVGVSRDQTDRERQYLKSLREELEKRKSQGEENLTIKYVRGVPEIATKKTHNKHCV